MHHVRDPQAADGKTIGRRDAYRIAIGVGWNDRRIVDLHDRISRRIDERELQGRSLRCVHETAVWKNEKESNDDTRRSKKERIRHWASRNVHILRISVGEVVNCDIRHLNTSAKRVTHRDLPFEKKSQPLKKVDPEYSWINLYWVPLTRAGRPRAKKRDLEGTMVHSGGCLLN